VYVPDYVSNLVYDWESRPRREFYERLARAFRLILFDKRGTGQFAALETRMDDLRAVLDAVGSTSAVVFGAHRRCTSARKNASGSPTTYASVRARPLRMP